MSERVLIVDDDPEATASLARVLRKKGCVVREENDSTLALQVAREFQPEVVVLDYLMPVVHGVDVAWQLASDPVCRAAQVIMCSAVPREEFVWKLPPCKIPTFEKPVPLDDLVALIQGGKR